MIRSTLSFVLLACPVVAQSAYEYITPPGAEFFEGNSASNIMLGNLGGSTRVQQIDNNLLGTIAPVIGFLGWRRDQVLATGTRPARMTDLSVTMGHSDFANASATFATNYLGAPQLVFAQRTVSLPDWSPAATLATFDVRLPLDVPFSYNGTDALLWDVTKDNDPLTPYPHDWISGTAAFAWGALPQTGTPGCTTANGPMLHRLGLRTNGTTLDFGFRVEGAPSGANIGLLLGFSPLGVAVPGLCAPLYPQVVITLPSIGSADAVGDLPLAFSLSAPWTASSAGVPLYTQAFAIDATQTAGLPVAFSAGLLTATPTTTTWPGTNVKRIYSTTSSAAVTGTFATSAAPTLYGL